MHDFSNQKVKHMSLRNATVVASDFTNANLSGDIGGLVINSVQVAPLIAAELERLYPERKELFTTTPEGMKSAYDIVFRLLDATFDRARALTEEQRNERVDDEWSTVETVRHLVFAVDSWILRAVLGHDDPHHPIGLPFSEMNPNVRVKCDPDARPTFEEAVAVWKDRERIIREVLEGLTPEELEREIVLAGEGYPAAGLQTQVIGPLWTILEESWWHNRFMNRDLDVIEKTTGDARSAAPSGSEGTSG
jgi:hypothetical protein